jgi:hypothetical protein
MSGSATLPGGLPPRGGRAQRPPAPVAGPRLLALPRRRLPAHRVQDADAGRGHFRLGFHNPGED